MWLNIPRCTRQPHNTERPGPSGHRAEADRARGQGRRGGSHQQSPQGMPPAVPPGGRASPSLRGPRTPGVTVARGDLLPRSRPSLSSGQRPLSPHQCHRSLLDECEHRLYALSGVSGGGREVRNWTRQSAQLWTGEARPNPCDPVTCGCDLTWKRGLCRCDHVQNLKIRSFWLIRVGPVPLAGVAVGDKRRRQREGAV